MKNVLIILIPLTIFACKPTIKNENNLLENVYGNDTLKIDAHFSECGEWGGHHETFRIFRNENKVLMFNFQKDTVNCLDPSNFNKRILEEQINILTKDDEIAVLKYIQLAASESFKNDGLGHSSNSYKVSRNYEKLLINFCDNSDDWMGFETLKKEILISK